MLKEVIYSLQIVNLEKLLKLAIHLIKYPYDFIYT